MGVCYPAHHRLTKICIWLWALKLIFVATRKICLIEGQHPQLFLVPQTCSYLNHVLNLLGFMFYDAAEAPNEKIS